MRGDVLVAIAAAIGNALQGWDNSNIAGAVMYIKKEFDLESEPTIEGLVVAMSLIGGIFITMLSGTLSDRLGRRPMLIISALLFFVGGLVMSWSPNAYVLLCARLLDGFGTGLAVTVVPVYISETAPSEIRGQLNTLPQFTGSGGMFLSYCMVFGMSLMDSPSWRLMLGFISIPSLVYFALTVFYLPESPRWLVSKGRILEAKQVLQRLRGCDDVSGELALLVEGLGTGGETSLEEYVVGPANGLIDDQDTNDQNDHIWLSGTEEGLTWIAKPVTGQGSQVNQSSHLKDPLVSLFGSVHEKLNETGSMKSIFSSNIGSTINISDQNGKKGENSDIEIQKRSGIAIDYNANFVNVSDSSSDDDNLQIPLLSNETSFLEKGVDVPTNDSNLGRVASSTDIGGGWQLAWQYSEKIGEDGKKEGSVKRIYLQNVPLAISQRGSLVSVQGGAVAEQESEFIHTAALVSQSALCPKDLVSQQSLGLSALQVHPKHTDDSESNWKGILEPGVKRALVVGIGLQILQQVSGINGVLYYTPQILEKAGVPVLLSSLGISSASASLLISALTTFLMLPCIGLSMWLMEVAGRRSLLLTTIPILIISLTMLVFGSIVDMGTILNATILTTSVVVYLCCFVMGFGVIPNILCSEIFPTRVRSLCIALCALTYWIGNVMITYSFPVLFKSLGLGGVFGIYVVGCTISWIFIFVKVPETKGMPLEVISEFFAVSGQ